MWDLPFKRVIALDFEFVADPGTVPVPVCMVSTELGTNRVTRLWQDDFGPEPPFPVDDDTLFLAYYASAELGCFLSLNWPTPTRILDLYTEFRVATNGIPLPNGRGLLGATCRRCSVGSCTPSTSFGRTRCGIFRCRATARRC